jgi:hypothetical protein
VKSSTTATTWKPVSSFTWLLLLALVDDLPLSIRDINADEAEKGRSLEGLLVEKRDVDGDALGGSSLLEVSRELDLVDRFATDLNFLALRMATIRAMEPAGAADEAVGGE